MLTRNLFLFSCGGITIYSVVSRDGSIRNRNKFKKYNDSSRILVNKFKKDNPEKRIMYDQRSNEKRKDWGCVPVNAYFKGSAFHHLHIQGNKDVGMYVPEELHRCSHSHKDGSILVMNGKAMHWFVEQDMSSYSPVFAAIVSY